MSSAHHKKLRLEVVAVTLCFSLIPLFAVGIMIHYQYDTAYDNKAMQGAKRLADNGRKAVDLFLEERVTQLKTLADTHSSEQLKDNAYLQRLLNVMRGRSNYFIDIGVVDSEGGTLTYAGPYRQELMSANYSDEAWFKAVMASHVYVSDVFRSSRKTPSFIIAVTNSSADGTWILRATVDADVITNIVRQGQVGKKGDAFIVNRENILQTQPRLRGAILGHPNSPDFSRSVGTNVEKIDFNGNETLFATSELVSPKWVLVVTEDTLEELAPLFMAQNLVALILVLGGVLVVVGTIFTSRSIMNQLIRVEHEKAISDDIAAHSGKMAALGKLAAGVAHEINNPVAIIGAKAGWVGDLLNKEDIANNLNLAECAECISNIERQVERCRAITHRMLGFARRMEPSQESTDINWLLSETITFLENEARHREITIQQHYDERLKRIATDAAQLQQVFLNVIDNAIDAIGKGGTIDVRTCYAPTEHEIVVEFEDNGPGIPKKILERIFDPFFTTKGVKAGTGLGLSISHSIIEKLGGRISVASEEGRGTTFRICLPVK